MRRQQQPEDDLYNAWLMEFPTLQRRVYYFLRNLSPNFVGFFLQANKELTFNQDFIDYQTSLLIERLLVEQFEDSKLIMTEDDVVVAFTRLKELMYLYEGLRQGVFVEVEGKGGSIEYKLVETPQSRPVQTQFLVKTPRKYQATFQVG